MESSPTAETWEKLYDGSSLRNTLKNIKGADNDTQYLVIDKFLKQAIAKAEERGRLTVERTTCFRCSGYGMAKHTCRAGMEAQAESRREVLEEVKVYAKRKQIDYLEEYDKYSNAGTYGMAAGLKYLISEIDRMLSEV